MRCGWRQLWWLLWWLSGLANPRVRCCGIALRGVGRPDLLPELALHVPALPDLNLAQLCVPTVPLAICGVGSHADPFDRTGTITRVGSFYFLSGPGDSSASIFVDPDSTDLPGIRQWSPAGQRSLEPLVVDDRIFLQSPEEVEHICKHHPQIADTFDNWAFCSKHSPVPIPDSEPSAKITFDHCHCSHLLELHLQLGVG